MVLHFLINFVISSFYSTERIKKTVCIETSTVEIEERGVKLRLTVVDTPGFGDDMDNNDWYVSLFIQHHMYFLYLTPGTFIFRWEV